MLIALVTFDLNQLLKDFPRQKNMFLLSCTYPKLNKKVTSIKRFFEALIKN